MMHLTDVDALHMKYGNPTFMDLLYYYRQDLLVGFVAFIVLLLIAPTI